MPKERGGYFIQPAFIVIETNQNVIKSIVGFEVLTVITMRSYSWDVTLCGPVKVNRRFGGTNRLHLQC
jgi:hypothetical protein